MKNGNDTTEIILNTEGIGVTYQESIIALKNVSLNVPAAKLTAILGPSGCGKTSILRAIFFVLFGEGNKVQHYGETSCSVEMIYGDMNIVRTKRPNRLVVNGVYEDGVGQEIINKKFGETFKTSGYIQQNNLSSFILMSPGDKLSFLEKFAFSDINLGDLKNKCSRQISALHDEHTQTLGMLATSREILGETPKPEKVKFPLKTEDKNKTYENEKIRLRNTVKRIQGVMEKKTREENRMNALKVYRAEIDSRKNIIEECKKELCVLTEEIEGIDYFDLSGLEEELSRVKKYCEYKIECNKLEEWEKKLSEIYSIEMKGMSTEIQTLEIDLWSEYTEKELLENIKE